MNYGVDLQELPDVPRSTAGDGCSRGMGAIEADPQPIREAALQISSLSTENSPSDSANYRRTRRIRFRCLSKLICKMVG